MLGLSGNPAAPQQTCGDEVARKDFVAPNTPFLIALNYSCGARPSGWSAGRQERFSQQGGGEVQEL